MFWLMTEVDRHLRTLIPTEIAALYGITPGVQLEWTASGDHIEIVPLSSATAGVNDRLELFDASTARQIIRQAGKPSIRSDGASRGWTREDLYSRGEPR